MGGVVKMKLKDLYDKPLRYVLENYCMMYSPECDQYYGISKWDDCLEMMYELEKKHGEDEVSVFFVGEYLIPYDLFGLEDDTEIKDSKKLRETMEYLGLL